MSAEDYFPVYDYADPFQDYGDESEPRSYKRRPRVLPVCKYCGTPDLRWVQSDGFWRLYTADNQPHQCAPKSRPPFNPSAILAPTMKTANLPPQPTQRSPIMDRNAPAFIRNDIFSIEIIFENCNFALDSKPAPISDSAKRYTYLCNIPGVQRGDLVVVSANGHLKVVPVVSANPTPAIDLGSDIQYQYVVARLDPVPYLTLLTQNKVIMDTLQASHQQSLREAFRTSLLSSLPEQQQAFITSILSSKE